MSHTAQAAQATPTTHTRTPAGAGAAAQPLQFHPPRSSPVARHAVAQRVQDHFVDRPLAFARDRLDALARGFGGGHHATAARRPAPPVAFRRASPPPPLAAS